MWHFEKKNVLNLYIAMNHCAVCGTKIKKVEHKVPFPLCISCNQKFNITRTFNFNESKTKFINAILSNDDASEPVIFANLVYVPKHKTITVFIHDNGMDNLFEYHVTDANKKGIVDFLDGLKIGSNGIPDIDSYFSSPFSKNGGSKKSKKSKSKHRRGRKLRRRTRKN
jgi:hypothetical protein